MLALRRSGLVWSLLLCLVLMNGFMAAPSVTHAAHHATHQAGTHSTSFCAWLCAAGQGIESGSIDLESTFQLVDRVVHIYLGGSDLLSASPVFLRGPPPSR